MDAFLLAAVYIELLGEKQATLVLASENAAAQAGGMRRAGALRRPAPLPARLTAEMLELHQRFVETLGPKAIWKRFVGA